MKYAFLLLSIAFNAVQFVIYKSISHKEVDILWYATFALGLMFGAINVVFFTKALKGINLNIAYPVFSGISIFLMITLSHFIFAEKISVLNVIGAFVIVAGVSLITN
jgi:multidrug transporter EmrE-like cation transporter